MIRTENFNLQLIPLTTLTTFKPAQKRSSDLGALGRPHEIGWENNNRTKLTMEPSPKTKELRPIGVQLH